MISLLTNLQIKTVIQPKIDSIMVITSRSIQKAPTPKVQRQWTHFSYVLISIPPGRLEAMLSLRQVMNRSEEIIPGQKKGSVPVDKLYLRLIHRTNVEFVKDH